MRVGHFVGGNEPRTQRPERLARLALQPLPVALHLEAAFGHVVANAIPSHIGHGVFFFDVARTFAHHERDLQFPIHAIGALGIDDVVERARDRVAELVEQNGLGWDVLASLTRMISIVEPDRYKAPGSRDWRPKPRSGRGKRQRIWIERAQLS